MTRKSHRGRNTGLGPDELLQGKFYGLTDSEKEQARARLASKKPETILLPGEEEPRRILKWLPNGNLMVEGIGFEVSPNAVEIPAKAKE